MKTITIRELLHNPTRALRTVEHVGTVRLTRRGQPVARLIPEPKPSSGKIKWPDFAARAKAYSDGVCLTAEQAARIIRENRGNS